MSFRIVSVLTLALAASAQAQQAKELRLGVFPNVTHAAGLVAVNKGLIQKELGSGVKLVVREFANGSQVNEAFAAGAIDASYVGPGPAMNAFLRGVPVQVYAGAANAGAVLVGRKDSGIRNVKGLAGKKVAVPTRGSTQDISLRHLLHENGLKASDEGGNVTIVPIDPANMPAAFAGKQVDAALVQEPWGAVMEGQGAKLIVNEKGIWNGGNYTSTVLVVNTKYADANPENVKDLLRGHLDLILLSIIRGEPKYGLEISKQASVQTGGYFDLRVGSLYPALHRLEKAGFVRSEFANAARGNATVKLYRLTESGERELAARQQEFQTFAAQLGRLF